MKLISCTTYQIVTDVESCNQPSPGCRGLFDRCCVPGYHKHRGLRAVIDNNSSMIQKRESLPLIH